MPKMLGKAKHMGTWSIDKWSDNRAARAQEKRLVAREAAEDMLWDRQDHDDVEGPETGAGGLSW